MGGGGLKAWDYGEKLFFWLRECSCGRESLLVWPELALKMNGMGARPLLSSSEPLCWTREPLVRCLLFFSISSKGVYLKIFLTTYPYMMYHLWVRS
jgi:hypothetical protein